jgi:hypothetical protein
LLLLEDLFSVDRGDGLLSELCSVGIVLGVVDAALVPQLSLFVLIVEKIGLDGPRHALNLLSIKVEVTAANPHQILIDYQRPIR